MIAIAEKSRMISGSKIEAVCWNEASAVDGFMAGSLAAFVSGDQRSRSLSRRLLDPLPRSAGRAADFRIGEHAGSGGGDEVDVRRCLPASTRSAWMIWSSCPTAGRIWSKNGRGKTPITTIKTMSGVKPGDLVPADRRDSRVAAAES